MGIGDDFIARVRVDLDGQLIGQRARRYENAVFLAEQGSRLFDEFVDARVFAEHIIAHEGLGDGLAHRLCGACGRIASEIDEMRGQRVDLPGSGPHLRESEPMNWICFTFVSGEYICTIASDLPNYCPVILGFHNLH